MYASVALTLTSCLPGLHISESVAGGTEEMSVSEVSGSAVERRFDFVLKAGRRELSGMMVSRAVSEDSVRVVGTTYFGLTLFDMTLTEDSYTMNSCADFLSNKAFASFLAMKLRKTVM